MPETPVAANLLSRVQLRLRLRSIASSGYVWGMVVLCAGIVTVLAVRLLGLVPRSHEQPHWFLLMPLLAAAGAGLCHRRIRQSTAAHAIDRHAHTKDLFLTLASLPSSAGEYQPLVAKSAETRAEEIDPGRVVTFRPWKRLSHLGAVAALMGLAVWLTPQLDPFGTVAAVEQQEQARDEIQTIHRANENQREQLKRKSRQAGQGSDEIENEVEKLKTDFRKMRPNGQKANAKVLAEHRSTLGDQWKSQSTDRLREMLNRPISRQQMGGSRSAKMNEWLSELQEGRTDSLRKQLQQAQQTMQALMEAKDPEERRKIQSQLKNDLQDLKKFASDRARSKELASALSKALKALEAGRPQNSDSASELMSQDAMEAVRESLELSEQELEQLARTAKDLKKLEDALKTLQQAQNLNNEGQLDGEKLEGCETLDDYAEIYAQMTGLGEAGGEKDINEGGGGGAGKGGGTPEDGSQPEGYRDEKSKARIRAGKVLLSIKTKEYAEEAEIDPDAVRRYQDSVKSLKDSVQSAIENEQIPPGYEDAIKKYFDSIENVDPALKSADAR